MKNCWDCKYVCVLVFDSFLRYFLQTHDHDCDSCSVWVFKLSDDLTTRERVNTRPLSFVCTIVFYYLRCPQMTGAYMPLSHNGCLLIVVQHLWHHCTLKMVTFLSVANAFLVLGDCDVKCLTNLFIAL